MSDSSTGFAISMLILAIVISLAGINYSIQQQTNAINQANPNYVSESIQSSISQSIRESISTSSYSAYCNSISSQANQNLSAGMNLVAGACPGGLLSISSTILYVVLAITFIAIIVAKVLESGYY